MFFKIDASNGVPIYDQIVRQIKYAVAEGVLTPGQMIPSVRQLSQELVINPNTIARAYLQLQSDLVVEPLRGRGLVIRNDATKRCTKARQDLIVERLRSVLEEAIHGGLTAEDLRPLFERILGEIVRK